MTLLQPARCVATLALAILAASGTPARAHDARPSDLLLHHHAARTRHTAIANGSTGAAPSSSLDDLAYDSPLRPSAAPLAAFDSGPLVQDASFRTFSGSASTTQTGLASWYGGRRWQGNRTSDGSRFDENDLTAAHASLPLGSHVRVTLVGTNQSVVVRITDRPGTRRRIIDLSRAAAAALGMLDRGLATVALQPL